MGDVYARNRTLNDGHNGAGWGLDPFLAQEQDMLEDEVIYIRPQWRPTFSRSVGIGSKTLVLVLANKRQEDACRYAHSARTIEGHDLSIKRWSQYINYTI